MGSIKKESLQCKGSCFCGAFSRYLFTVLCLCFRKLRATLDEYTTRVGQQAIVLCISPSKPNPVFKVFGAAPLENVVGVSRKKYIINCSPSLQVSFCSRQPCKPSSDLKVMFNNSWKQEFRLYGHEGSTEVLSSLHEWLPSTSHQV